MRSSGSSGTRVVLLDQRRLPDEEVELACRSAAEVAEAIRTLASAARPRSGSRPRTGTRSPRRAGEDLDAAARGAAARRGRRRSTSPGRSRRCARRPRPGRPRARELHDEEVERCRRMAGTRPALLEPGTRALTHCNTGALATGGVGTALGALRAAWERGLLAARLRRRDAAAPAGRAADGVGARGGRDPAHGDRRLGRGLADARAARSTRLHRRRPHRRERRHREQDRHVRARGARRAPRDPVLRRRAELDRRPRAPRAAPRSRSRSATRRR